MGSEMCIRDRNKNGQWEIFKEYGKVNVGSVQSSDYSGDIAVVGGINGSLRFINMRKGQLIGQSMETAIGEIWSVQLSRVSENAMHLTVGGVNSDYSNSKADVFDVSGMFNLNGKIKEEKKQVDSVKDLQMKIDQLVNDKNNCLLYTSPSPRDLSTSRMPSSA